MNKFQTIKFDSTDKKSAIVVTMVALAFVALSFAQDFLRAALKHSAFYFSESILFSSFWWLFAPILYIQYFSIKHTSKRGSAFQLSIIILPILFHLFAFPLLVWTLSSLFYYHAYSVQQTFTYTLSENSYLLVIIYTIPVLTILELKRKQKLGTTAIKTQNYNSSNPFFSTIVVTERNKKLSILISDILYFSANPPYINLHLEGKKYLYNETLKAILPKLNPEQFVRVHKSTIVNIKMVDSYSTRLNGDYDLMLKNNIQIRVSRNFAADFKRLFNQTHQVA